jgi:hypothetical protein
MNEQPEALRLADALDDLMGEETLIGAVHIDRASYELRRLNKENKRLREEVRVLRLYGNKDCTSMADEVLKQEQPR